MSQNSTASLLGIDIGGSGIKGALVDPHNGELISDRHRIDIEALTGKTVHES